MFAEIVQWTSLLSLLLMAAVTVYFSLRNLGWINQAPIGYQGCHPGWQSFSRHQNWQLLWQISLAVIASRLLLFTVVQIAFHLIHPSDNDLLAMFRDLWYRWDTNSFLVIAEHGYVNEGKDRLLLVFYPLYPALVHLMTYLIPDKFFAAVVVSNICLILACFTLFKLVMFEFHQRDIAAASVKYLLIYPFSFFASIAYTESTFLLMTLACFYFCRRGMFPAAALFGFAAALTRNHGILLLVPMVYEVLRQGRYVAEAPTDQKWRYYLTSGLACCALPLGIGVYLAINKWVSGDWFQFLIYQKENWHNSFGFFAQNLATFSHLISDAEFFMVVGTWLPTFTLFFFCLAVLALCMRRLPQAYILYGLVYLFISYSPSWLLSGPRYLLGMFPLFIGLAVLAHQYKKLGTILDKLMLMLLILYCVIFFRNGVY